MIKQVLIIAASATLAIAAATTDTAQATVAGPSTATPHSAQSLKLLHEARRVCRRVWRCGQMGQGCWWEQQCFITPDYPPERRD